MRNTTKKQTKKKSIKLTMADYMKAIKKADREIQLAETTGFRSVTRIHKNKKIYDRKNNKQCFDTDE